MHLFIGIKVVLNNQWHSGGAFDIPGAARPGDLPSADLLREFEQHEALSHQQFDDIFEQGRQHGGLPGSAFRPSDHQETRLIAPCLQVICQAMCFSFIAGAGVHKVNFGSCTISVMQTAPINAAASSCNHHFLHLRFAASFRHMLQNCFCACCHSTLYSASDAKGCYGNMHRTKIVPNAFHCQSCLKIT